jgi:hypothetical protein
MSVRAARLDHEVTSHRPVGTVVLSFSAKHSDLNVDRNDA